MRMTLLLHYFYFLNPIFLNRMILIDMIKIFCLKTLLTQLSLFNLHILNKFELTLSSTHLRRSINTDTIKVLMRNITLLEKLLETIIQFISFFSKKFHSIPRIKSIINKRTRLTLRHIL